MTRINSTLLWSIAEMLRGPYQPNQYGDVILPFTVLRWLDATLAPEKEAVLAEYEKICELGIDPCIAMSSKFNLQFFNTSVWDLRKLTAHPTNLAENLLDYVEGFSSNIRDIFDGYRLPSLIAELDRRDRLYLIVKEFANVDLHPDRVSRDEIDYIFKDLIRKGVESNNAQDGDHFTPPDVAGLMVNLLYADRDLELTAPGIVRTIYDATAGSGGVLSVAHDRLVEMNPQAEPVLYGQEINHHSYAMCKSDMVIKGQSADNFYLGDILSDDGFSGHHFDFLISSPPFGVDWKTQQQEVTNEHEQLGHAGRFGPGLPRVSDGSLLFLLHLIKKMRAVRSPEDQGSRLAIVLNGSPMSTGGAGSGESNIRQWIIENDLLDAIIALPSDMFYNTGISTYIWILDNKKADHRRGKIQLIRAVDLFGKMRNSLGSKRKQLRTEDIQHICNVYQEFRHDDNPDEPALSKVFANEDFGHCAVMFERPLRLSFHMTDRTIERVLESKNVTSLTDDAQRCVRGALSALNGRSWFNREKFVAVLTSTLKDAGMLQPNAFLVKAIWMTVGERDPDAPVVKAKGEPEADSSLRVVKNIPLGRDIEDYFEREVVPYALGAWINHEKTRIGYSISWMQFISDEFDSPTEPIRHFIDVEAEQEYDPESQGACGDLDGIRILRAQNLHTVNLAVELPVETLFPRKFRECTGSTIVGIPGNWRILPPEFGEAITPLFVLHPKNGASGFALCEWLNSFNKDINLIHRQGFLDIPVPVEIVTDPEIGRMLTQVTETRRRLQATVSKMLFNSFSSRERRISELRRAVASTAHEVRLVGGLIQPLEDPIWRAESTYPFHVAALARHHRIRSHPAERVDSLLKLGEGLARALGMLCLAEIYRTNGFTVQMQRQFRAGASFGTWTNIIRQMENNGTLPTVAHLKLLSAPNGILGSLEKVREYRNSTHHSHGVRADHEMNMLAAELEPHIALAISKSSWLSENPWFWVERCEYLDSDSYRISGLRMHGSHPGWEPFEKESSTPVRPNRVYVEDAYSGASLDLSPFAIVELCERCQVRELFLLDQILQDGTLVLRSLVEHSVEVAAPF